jgi:hypothetical protein
VEDMCYERRIALRVGFGPTEDLLLKVFRGSTTRKYLIRVEGGSTLGAYLVLLSKQFPLLLHAADNDG